jgi:hypothetical protein
MAVMCLTSISSKAPNSGLNAADNVTLNFDRSRSAISRRKFYTCHPSTKIVAADYLEKNRVGLDRRNGNKNWNFIP